MLDIKKVIPKEKQEAVYVTRENIKEFLKLAFPNEFKLDTLFIDESESPYIYASVRYRDCYITARKQYENFILNTWYVTDERNDLAWCDDEYFEENYDIEQTIILFTEGVSKMRELVCDPAKIDLNDFKEESFAVNHERYDKWNEFRNYMYQLHEMRNKGCRGCEEPPTTCRKCMQDYYWLNIKHYL